MEILVRFPGRKRQVTEGSQRAPRKRIGELLVLDGLITEGQLRTALEVQRGQRGRILDRLAMLGYLSAQAVSTFLARQPGVSSIVLSNYMVRADLTGLIPREYAESRQVFPIDRLGKLLTVGMACPLDDATIQELEAATGLCVKPMLCSRPNALRPRSPATVRPTKSFVRAGWIVGNLIVCSGRGNPRDLNGESPGRLQAWKVILGPLAGRRMGAGRLKNHPN